MVRVETSVSSERLISSIHTQRQILLEEEARRRDLVAERDDAIDAIQRIERELDASEKRAVTIVANLRLFEELAQIVGPELGPPRLLDDSPGNPLYSTLNRAKPIARLGRQHYLMLSALRRSGPLSAYDVAPLSGVDPRRVKQVMSGDLERGYVTLSPRGFSLTPTGLDVLQRFENFRCNEGKALPSLSDKQQDDAELEVDVTIE